MKEMKIFSHEMFGEIRTMTNESGETYFVGKDVAEALGYTNTQKAIRNHVDDDDKLTERFVLSGQNRSLVIISEGELHTRTYLVWTEKGRKFIHRMCKTEEIMIPFLLSVEVTNEEV